MFSIPADEPSSRSRARIRGTGTARARRGYTLAAIALAAAVGLAGGAGQALAVDPTVARTDAGCAFVSDQDRASNIQTCWVWSESMQTTVTVKVRASDKQAAQPEQAIYFLGSLSDPSANGRDSLYDTGYNLVAIPDSATTWSSDWQSTPRDNNGNPLTNSDGTFTPQWETFIGEELPVFLNQNFEVGTSGNAVSGLSISGGQAINLALKYPEVFSVAVSRSGYYQTNNLLGYLAIPFILASRQGVSNGFDAMWGNPFLPGNSWADNDVAARLAQAKANGQTIIVSSGNGQVASQAEWDEMMAQGGIAQVVVGVGLEIVSYASTLLLNAQAAIFGLPVDFIYTDGAHTWNRWIRTDEAEAQKLQDALTKYQQSAPVTPVVATSAVAPVVDLEPTRAVTTAALAPAAIADTAATTDPSDVTPSEPATTSPTAATGPAAPTASDPDDVDDERDAAVAGDAGTVTAAAPTEEDSSSDDNE